VRGPWKTLLQVGVMAQHMVIGHKSCPAPM
jgi:hypothetical protein